MSFAMTLFVLTVLAMLAFSWAVIWSRKDTWVRHAVIPLTICLVPMIGFLAVNTLGWHRPVSLAWELEDDIEILAYKFVLDKAIYVYINQEGEPIAVSLPWSEQLAQKMQDAFEQNEEEGGAGVHLRFDQNALIEESTVYALPQEANPLKEGE